MRVVTFFALAAALGAGAYWGVTQILDGGSHKGSEAQVNVPESQEENAVGSAAPLRQPAAVSDKSVVGPAPAVRGPVFFQGQAERNSGEILRSADPPSAPSEPSEPRVQKLTGIEEERRQAFAAFDSGDVKRGVKLLEEMYAIYKEREGVDMSAEVKKLAEVETQSARKLEYLKYLAKSQGGAQAFEDQLSRAVRRIPEAENAPENAITAWDDLSLAYGLANDRSQRKKVVSYLEPFIRQMVFSDRPIGLLKTHMVQAGESLSSIANLHHTTTDAIRRINKLKTDVIHPKQRLRVLPGKTKLFVDKSEFILWATIDGRVFLEFLVGIGLKGTPTPVGAFVVKVRQKDPTWWRPGETPIPPGDPKNILGSRWLGFGETQDYTGYGIHGTSDPASLGTDSSAGCVRLRNEDMELLYDFVTLGTEVVIQP